MTDLKTWHEGMSDAETKDLAYWERNMLALRYADGWYNDDMEVGLWPHPDAIDQTPWVEYVPRYERWRRVLSLEGGRMTFHIPDDFDVGDLPEIKPNWDGHSTEQKWRYVQACRGIK